MPHILRLLALACALAALVVPGVAAATAAGEVTTPTTEEIPPGEAITEPVVPPVKEVTEKAANPKREGSGEEPAAAPQTTAPTSTPTTTTGESSGTSTTPTATAPTKAPTTTHTSSSSSHSGGGHEGSSGAHGATSQGGTLPNPTGTAPQSSQGGGGEAAAEPTYPTGASEVAGVATTSTETAEAETSTDPQPQAAAPPKAKVDPPAKAKLDEAEAVEHAPVTKPAPSRTPLQTVSHVLTRPFEEPTSTSALVAYLCLLIGAAAIGLAFWFEIGGTPERAYWYGRKLTDMVGLNRRGR